MSAQTGLSESEIDKYIQLYLTYEPRKSSQSWGNLPAGSPTTTSAPSNATSYADDPHAVSIEEADSYYAGLASKPSLLYRTGDKWVPPQSPGAQHRQKQLVPVFGGQLERAWNEGGLSWDVMQAMDDHAVVFKSLNIVRFKTVGGADDVSPLTMYIAVVPGSTAPTAAHNAAKDVKVLLEKYNITDTVNIEFAEIH
ncbi:hypothetical protein K466DRAFT_49335 [Polyporus arcularius HHB13444]|uniref:Uncharacterized protein n=1 Tax=Polyporus arcularius HHB13444 TaxID=1314778 RepID=A0A5C3PVQ0_9APHY|nr:hypothetical protein K466DRAFT_49335 [Polyporus arcularius HHB13444]